MRNDFNRSKPVPLLGGSKEVIAGGIRSSRTPISSGGAVNVTRPVVSVTRATTEMALPTARRTRIDTAPWRPSPRRRSLTSNSTCCTPHAFGDVDRHRQRGAFVDLEARCAGIHVGNVRRQNRPRQQGERARHSRRAMGIAGPIGDGSDDDDLIISHQQPREGQLYEAVVVPQLERSGRNEVPQAVADEHRRRVDGLGGYRLGETHLDHLNGLKLRGIRRRDETRDRRRRSVVDRGRSRGRSTAATLPPVSVARTCKVNEVASGDSCGAIAKKSNGKETSLRTTTPLTSNSTFLTCRSSLTLTCTGDSNPRKPADRRSSNQRQPPTC